MIHSIYQENETLKIYYSAMYSLICLDTLNCYNSTSDCTIVSIWTCLISTYLVTPKVQIWTCLISTYLVMPMWIYRLYNSLLYWVFWTASHPQHSFTRTKSFQQADIACLPSFHGVGSVMLCWQNETNFRNSGEIE